MPYSFLYNLDYDSYRNTKEKYEKFLNDLSRGEATEQNTFVQNYVKRMIKQLATVPDSDKVLKKMKYLDKNIEKCIFYI